jgi:hypothetical protein
MENRYMLETCKIIASMEPIVAINNIMVMGIISVRTGIPDRTLIRYRSALEGR